MGKTTLARAFVRASKDAGRVAVFVDLSHTLDRSDVASAIERNLVNEGILASTDAERHWSVRILVPTILVLDNAEQALEAIGDEVADVLEQTDLVRFVVTTDSSWSCHSSGPHNQSSRIATACAEGATAS